MMLIYLLKRTEESHNSELSALEAPVQPSAVAHLLKSNLHLVEQSTLRAETEEESCIWKAEQ